jgi:hypothetical protein
MTIRIFGIAAAIVLGLTGAAFAQARAPLSGLWVGYYSYDGQGAIVQFQAKLAGAGASFAGATIEPNTFGTSDVLFLTANVTGSADAAGKVSFIKTYDGTGGQTHSVQYAGTFEPGGACVSGTWRLDAASGPFRMCVAQKPNA